jgi:hypothetical protein
MTVNHGTDTAQLDEALARILSEPSWAHRLLQGIADVLDNQPFLTVNEALLTEACDIATSHVLGHLTPYIADQARQVAMDEMPEAYPGETAGSLAARIRAAAEDVR